MYILCTMGEFCMNQLAAAFIKRTAVRISIRQKMMASFIGVAALVGAVSVIAYLFLHQIDRSASSIIHTHAKIVEQAASVETLTELQKGMLFHYLLEPSGDLEERLLKTNGELDATIKQLAGQLAEDDSSVAAMDESNQTFKRLVSKVTGYINDNRPDLAQAEAKMWAIQVSEQLTATANTIQAEQKLAMEHKLASNADQVTQLSRILLAGSSAALLLSVLIGYFLSHSFVSPMHRLVKAAKRIAAGDLTGEAMDVRNRDELGDLAAAFQAMNIHLRSMLAEVSEHANQIAEAANQTNTSSGHLRSASEQITTIVQEIAHGTEQQAGSIESSTVRIEAMSGSMSRMEEVVGVARETTAAAQEAALHGRTVMDATVRQMSAISSTMGILTGSVQRLGERSEKIQLAIELISGIARHTNLLSLNASIEAARAGAAGRGFTVVANEIRQLSSQTASAAREIAELIASIRTETGDVVASAKGSADAVQAGTRVVADAGGSFERIGSAVADMARQIEQIAVLSQATAEEADNAAQSMQHIREVAKEAAAGAQNVSAHVEEQYAGTQQIHASAQLLSHMSVELKLLAGKFKV